MDGNWVGKVNPLFLIFVAYLGLKTANFRFMTPEQEFIRKVEVFFDDPIVINDKVKNRLLFLLKQYRDELPPVVVEKEVIKPVKILRFIPTKKLLNKEPNKCPIVNQDILDSYALEFAKAHGLELKEFKERPLSGKCKGVVRMARTDFCKFIMTNYQCTQEILKDYFQVDHTTMVYYIRGQRGTKIA